MWRKHYIFLQIVFLTVLFSSPLQGKEQSGRVIPNPPISAETPVIRDVAVAKLAIREFRASEPLGRDIVGVGQYAVIEVEMDGVKWMVDLSLAPGYLCYASSPPGNFKTFRSKNLHQAAIECAQRKLPKAFADLVLLAEAYPDSARSMSGPVQDILKRKGSK